MSMVEKVARAITASDDAQDMGAIVHEAFEQCPVGTKPRAMRYARLALEALLEPDEAMVEAGIVAPHNEPDGSGEYGLLVTPDQTKTVFTAMIQAALASQEA